MADLIESGASSLIASPSMQGQPAQGQAPANVELIRRLISSGALPPPGGQQGGQNLTSFGPQMIQPQAPVRMGQPDIQYPTGSFGSAGERKRAQKAALFHGIASTVKTAGDYIQQKQVRAMAMDTERLMSATQGFNEAKAAGDQAAMKQNSDIINSMLDPSTSEGKKRIKNFQKAFNVNILGEHKDKDSPEYKGFTQAYQKFNQDKASGQASLSPIAQKLMQSMPQRQQVNPQLQAEAQLIKDKVLPDANAQLKAQTAGQLILTNAISKQFDRDSREKVAQLLADTRDKASQNAILRSAAQNTSRENVAQMVADSVKMRVDKHYDEVMNNPRWQLLKDKINKDDKSLQNLVNMTDKQIKELQKSKEGFDKKATKEHWYTSSDNTNAAKDTAAQITKLQAQQDAIIKAYGAKTNPDLDPTKDDDKSDQSKEDDNYGLSPEEMDILHNAIESGDNDEDK